MKKLFKTVRPFLIPVIITVMIIVLFHTVFMLGYVPTGSMEPTLKKGSYIIGIRIYSELKTGDIIIFHHDGKLLVKRIAATEGEVIERDGVGLTVPEGCYYVLGDNANNSYDSRYWSDPFVKEAAVVARLIC